MEIRECPFCKGNKLKVEYKNSNKIKYINLIPYHTVTASVRCNKCHSRGPTVSMNYLAGNSYDHMRVEEDLRIRACNIWNNR